MLMSIDLSTEWFGRKSNLCNKLWRRSACGHVRNKIPTRPFKVRGHSFGLWKTITYRYAT